MTFWNKIGGNDEKLKADSETAGGHAAKIALENSSCVCCDWFEATAKVIVMVSVP